MWSNINTCILHDYHLRIQNKIIDKELDILLETKFNILVTYLKVFNRLITISNNEYRLDYLMSNYTHIQHDIILQARKIMSYSLIYVNMTKVRYQRHEWTLKWFNSNLIVHIFPLDVGVWTSITIYFSFYLRMKKSPQKLMSSLSITFRYMRL